MKERRRMGVPPVLYTKPLNLAPCRLPEVAALAEGYEISDHTTKVVLLDLVAPLVYTSRKLYSLTLGSDRVVFKVSYLRKVAIL